MFTKLIQDQKAWLLIKTHLRHSPPGCLLSITSASSRGLIRSTLTLPSTPEYTPATMLIIRRVFSALRICQVLPQFSIPVWADQLLFLIAKSIILQWLARRPSLRAGLEIYTITRWVDTLFTHSTKFLVLVKGKGFLGHRIPRNAICYILLWV